MPLFTSGGLGLGLKKLVLFTSFTGMHEYRLSTRGTADVEEVGAFGVSSAARRCYAHALLCTHTQEAVTLGESKHRY